MGGQKPKKFGVFTNDDLLRHEVRGIVLGHFRCDAEKADAWFGTPNPLLGHITPFDVAGLKGWARLRTIVVKMIQDNIPATQTLPPGGPFDPDQDWWVPATCHNQTRYLVDANQSTDNLLLGARFTSKEECRKWIAFLGEDSNYYTHRVGCGSIPEHCAWVIALPSKDEFLDKEGVWTDDLKEAAAFTTQVAATDWAAVARSSCLTVTLQVPRYKTCIANLPENTRELRPGVYTLADDPPLKGVWVVRSKYYSESGGDPSFITDDGASTKELTKAQTFLTRGSCQKYIEEDPDISDNWEPSWYDEADIHFVEAMGEDEPEPSAQPTHTFIPDTHFPENESIIAGLEQISWELQQVAENARADVANFLDKRAAQMAYKDKLEAAGALFHASEIIRNNFYDAMSGEKYDAKTGKKVES